jgi:hypothetical protein
MYMWFETKFESMVQRQLSLLKLFVDANGARSFVSSATCRSPCDCIASFQVLRPSFHTTLNRNRQLAC